MSVEIVPATTSAPARRWKPYPAYKDSGVEWLREIPVEWNVNRIKFTSYVKGRVGWHGLRSEEFTDVGPFLVTGTDFSNGKINWETCHHFSEERYTEDPYIQLKENDLLITKDGTIGKVAIVEKLSGKASLNSGIMLIRPLNKHYMKEFMFWVLNSNLFSEYNEYTKAGSTIQHLYQETFEDFSFPIPPSQEQHAIASFLDRRTAHLDALISKKERLIALLEEKRAALISSAVTKGLDPNAPMKDSGVEWLGEVPEHWEVKRIKQIASKIGSGKTPRGGSEVYSESGVTFLRSQNIHFDGLRLDDVVCITESIDEEMASTRVFSKDVLLNITGASLGRCSLVPDDFPPANVNQHVCIIRPIKNFIVPLFLHNALTSKVVQAQIFSWENGTSREGLTFSQIANLVIVAPKGLEEQRAIASFLDRETERIDALISKVREGIEKLREYRTALISAAVTGKIDVRKEINNAT